MMTARDLAQKQAHDLSLFTDLADEVLAAAPFELDCAIHRLDLASTLGGLEAGLVANIAALIELDDGDRARDELRAAFVALKAHDGLLFATDKEITPLMHSRLWLKALRSTDVEAARAAADRCACDVRRREGVELMRRILARGEQLPARDPDDTGGPATARPYLMHQGRRMTTEQREQERAAEARQHGPGHASPQINNGGQRP